MKILLDHCVPKRFKTLLPGHQIRTAYEMGWSELSNGKLLAKASQEFDAFITVDQNVQFQQNLSVIPLPVAILNAPNNRFETITPYAPSLLNWLSKPPQRELVCIDPDGTIRRIKPT